MLYGGIPWRGRGPGGHRIGIRIGPRQLHAVRDSCLVIKVKFVNLQFSSKGRLLVDWTRLFTVLCSASTTEFGQSSAQVTVTVTLSMTSNPSSNS